MTINVTIPVWNESSILVTSIPALAEFLENRWNGHGWFIVISDNGSTDKTRVISQKLSNSLPRVHYHFINERGRGRAIKSSWQKYPAELYAYMDSDLDIHPKALVAAVEQIQYGADLAVGDRTDEASSVTRKWYRTIMSQVSTRLVKSVFGLHPSDTQCGLKVINKRVLTDVVPLVRETGWFFDLELLLQCRSHGLTIGTVPVEDENNRLGPRKSRVKIIKDTLDFIKTVYHLKRKGF